MTEKLDVDDLCPFNSESIQYHHIADGKKWRVNFILEAIDVRLDQNEDAGFEDEEIEEILEHLCCS